LQQYLFLVAVNSVILMLRTTIDTAGCQPRAGPHCGDFGHEAQGNYDHDVTASIS